jgi:hypothetical protein
VPGRRGRGWAWSGYDTAQVCSEGHVINWFAASRPDRNADHCDQCGSATIIGCPQCSEPIRGYLHAPYSFVVGVAPDGPPSFCHKCGKRFPWIERKLLAASALIDEADGLSGSEKEALTKCLGDLVRDVSATEVAVVRFKKYLPKAGAAVYSAIKQVMISVVTEGVKKQLFGA